MQRGFFVMLRRSAVVAAVGLLGMGHPAVAQEMPLPVGVQLAVLSQVMQFDRNFTADRDEAVIAVLYQRRSRESTAAMDEATSVLRDELAFWFGGRPIRVVAVDVGGTDDPLALQWLMPARTDVVYLTPLRSFDVRSISQTGRDLGILTLTGVPEYVELGIAIGLDRERGRPRILVNLEAAIAGGADLSSELLKLARMVRS
ncbi:MAG: YfiR family protein [Gemmatimonadota bacterium]|nr:YfiR family protein [Gemmatimonadota bacterium]